MLNKKRNFINCATKKPLNKKLKIYNILSKTSICEEFF